MAKTIYYCFQLFLWGYSTVLMTLDVFISSTGTLTCDGEWWFASLVSSCSIELVNVLHTIESADAHIADIERDRIVRVQQRLQGCAIWPCDSIANIAVGNESVHKQRTETRAEYRRWSHHSKKMRFRCEFVMEKGYINSGISQGQNKYSYILCLTTKTAWTQNGKN